MYQMFNWRLSCVSDCRNYNKGQSNNVRTQNMIFRIVYFKMFNANILVTDNQNILSDCDGS